MYIFKASERPHQKAMGYIYLNTNYKVSNQFAIAMGSTRILYIQGTSYIQFWYKNNKQKVYFNVCGVFLCVCAAVRLTLLMDEFK